MKILVVVPTRDKNDPLVGLSFDYLNRLRLPFSANISLIEVPKKFDKHDSKIKMQEEGKAILGHTEGYFRIALDSSGKNYSSVDFSSWLNKLSLSHQKIAFIIGGAFGLDKNVLDKSNAIISLSTMTFPHKMALVMLAEQIYRSSEINFGSPYHK